MREVRIVYPDEQLVQAQPLLAFRLSLRLSLLLPLLLSLLLSSLLHDCTVLAPVS